MDKTIVQKFHNAYIDANSKELDNLWDNYAPKTVLKFISGKYTEQGDNYFLESASALNARSTLQRYAGLI